MRLGVVSLSAAALAFGLVACGAPGSEDAGGSVDDLRSATHASSGQPCSLSRDAILAAAPPARQRAMARGFQWLDDKVPYSQSASHGGYRTDCSGFVSMCWELDRSSTSNDLFAGSDDAPLDGFGELAPADAVVRRGHVMLFLAFDDAAQTRICVLEQASTKSDMQFRVHAIADLESQGYKPIRAMKLEAAVSTTSAAEAPATSAARVTAAPSGAAASGDPGSGDEDEANGSRLPPQSAGSCSASSAPYGRAPGAISLLGLALAMSLVRSRRRR